MAEMKDADIEIGVMPLRVYSGLPHVFYDQTEILELCNKYPGKFIAVPQIDPIGLPKGIQNMLHHLCTIMHCGVAAASHLHDNPNVKVLTFFIPGK